MAEPKPVAPPPPPAPPRPSPHRWTSATASAAGRKGGRQPKRPRGSGKPRSS